MSNGNRVRRHLAQSTACDKPPSILCETTHRQKMLGCIWFHLKSGVLFSTVTYRNGWRRFHKTSIKLDYLLMSRIGSLKGLLGCLKLVLLLNQSKKLNIDGSYLHGKDTIGAGGIIRDSNGCFVKAFIAKDVCCSVFRAELVGLLHGLTLAKEPKITNLIVEMDAATVVFTMKECGIRSCDSMVMLKKYKDLMVNTNWCIKINHIHRERNSAAEWLSKKSKTILGDFVLFDSPPGGTVLHL
ncbi:hypothetical protein V2J09_021684 [Rumex salicifolius]